MLTIFIKMEILFTMLRNENRDNSSVWVNLKMLDTTSTFTMKRHLDQSFIDLGPPWDQWILILEKDKRLCSKYDGCVVPIHEYLLFLIGFSPPFNTFEVGIFNQFLITHLQLHLVSWSYVKLFQYRWIQGEFTKSNVILPHFQSL